MRGTASVIAQITESTDIRIVRLLAETLCRLGDHANAFPLWQRVADRTKHIADAWQVVETAVRLKRYDLVLRLCRQWREAGVDDARLLDAELAVLEQFAPQEALQLLSQQVELHPENSLLRLGLSRLALQLDRPELACGDVGKLPPPSEVRVDNGSAAVHLLTELKKFDDALRYAYDLLRANRDKPEANLTLGWLVMTAGLPEGVLSPPSEVVPGTAVCFAEEAVSGVQWRVIEDHPGGPAFPEDLAPEHGLAKRLMGLRVGDVFVLAGDEVDGRKARILRSWRSTCTVPESVSTNGRPDFPTCPPSKFSGSALLRPERKRQSRI